MSSAPTRVHHAAAALAHPGTANMNHAVPSGQQLLFFDTFSHDLEAELNLDLVQFSQPVVVEEVRVIPLGARVEMNLPGGVRLGATNPKKFQLDFYVNALGKPGAPTFQSLGTLHYNDNERINLAMNKSIATDGLLLLGMYNTITLAVYGTPTRDTAEQLATRGSASVVTPSPAAVPVDVGDLHHPPPVAAAVAPPAAAAVLNRDNNRHHALPHPPPVTAATTREDPWYPRPHPQAVQQQQQHALPLPALQQPPPAVPWNSGDRFDHPPPQAPPHHMRHNTALNGSGAVHPEDPLHPLSLQHPHPHPHSHSHPPPHHIPPPSHHLHPPPTSHHHGPPPSIPPPIEMNHHQPQQQQQQPHRQQRHQRHERSSSREYNSGGRGRGSKSPNRRSRSPSLQAHDFQDKNHVERNKDRTQNSGAKQSETEPEPPENDILDDVSDISEGDIPDVAADEDKIKNSIPKAAEEAKIVPERNEVQENAVGEGDASPGLVEEISDEEADWSDDGGILDMDFDFGEDWEDPIKVFDPFQADLSPLILPRRTVLNLRTSDVEAALTAPLNQEWIEHIESFSVEMSKNPGTVDLDEELRKALLSLTSIALSLERAMEQEAPTMKVRHIKSGIAFARAAFGLERELAERLLKSGVQAMAMRIFEAEHMATSIKLSVIALLDDTLETKMGYDILVGARTASGCETNGDQIYGALLTASASGSTRTKASLCTLLSKVTVFETAQKLRTLCDDIISTQADESSTEIGLDDGELVAIVDYLIQALRIAPQVMSQPKRYLPVRFDPEPSEKHGCRSILRIFEECHLLRSIQLVLSWPNANSVLTAACQVLLQEIARLPGGVRFFADDHKTTNELIRLLVYGGVEDQSVGMRLCCCTYAEQAMSKVSHDASADLAGVVDSCQNLHSMIFFSAGQQFMVETLFTTTHLRAIVDFLSCPGIEDDLENVMQTTAKGFLKDILLVLFRRQPPSGPREHYGDFEKIFTEIVELAEMEEATSSFRRIILTIRPYLDVVNADVKKLTEVTQKNAESVNPVTKELLAAVRTLSWMMQGYKETSGGYKFLCQEIFSSGITDIYISILTKICTHHEQPNTHMATFAAGDTGFDLVSLVLSILCVLEKIFRNLVVARDSEFRDSGPISSFIKIHSLLSAVQTSSPYSWMAQEAAQGVRNILCIYTKPTFDAGAKKVSGSLWTIVASEVIEFTSALPHQFSSGLKLLSELLPLPLPLHTKTRLDGDSEEIVRARKLWSAHLYPLESQIRTMLKRITPVCDQSLSQTLRRTVIQLIDLSAPVAEMACEVILDCLDHLDPVNSARICGFVSSLVEDSESAKMAFLSLFEDKNRPNFQTVCDLLHKPGQPYHQARYSVASLLQSLCDPEISLAGSDANSEEYLKQSIPSHSLLDVILEACARHLASPADGLALNDAVSAAATATVIRTMGMLCEHDYGFARVKACLCNHHTGFFASVLEALLRQDLASSDCLSSMLLVAQALYTLPNDQSEYLKPRTLALKRGEVLALLSTHEETAESEEGEEPRRRLLERLVEKLGRIDKGEELKKLGIEVANALLESKLPSDGERESATEPMQVDRPTLGESFRDREISSFSEFPPKLSAVEWLSDFAAEEAPQQAPLAFSTEKRWIDLTAISRESLSKEFDLAEQMRVVCAEKGLLDERPKEGENGDASEHPAVSPHKKKGASAATRKSILERRAAQSKSIISNFRSGGGRGGGGGGHRGHQNFHHHHSRSDGFRSRPPNTSRPPSLHVDDFMLLQARGQQPTGPTGYNKQSIKAAKELFAEREAAAVAHQQKATMGASSIVGFREATKQPVYSFPDNGGGRGGGGGGGGGTRGGGGRREGFGRGGRRGWKSWSPDVGAGGAGGRFPDRRGGRGGGGGGPWRGFRERSKFGDRMRYPR